MRQVPRWWYWALASISWFVLALASCYQPLACLQDGDCEQGFHCQPQSGECLQLCSPSRPCSAGQRCDLSKGRCLTSPPACSPRARRACLNGHMMWIDSCGLPEEQSDDCGAFGCTDAGCNPAPCGDGSCDASAGENCNTCASDCGCQSHEQCAPSGSCTPQPKGQCGDGTCATGGTESCASCPKDCGCDPQLGNVCANAQCQPTCPDGKPCHDGKKTGTCVAGKCLPKDAQCQSNVDCKDGNVCKQSQCVPCQADADCGSNNQCQSGACAIGISKDQDAWQWSDGTAATSCQAYKRPPSGFVAAAKDGQYWLSAGNSRYRTYCLMESHGGGWTLALKLDGRKKTFVYNAKLWTNGDTLNPNDTKMDLKEAKLQSFSQVSFAELLVGMRDLRAGQIRYVKVGHKDESLQKLFHGAKDDDIDKPASYASWRALLADSSFQSRCRRQVINYIADNEFQSSRYSSVVGQLRIGILGNNENDCGSVDSFIGFGSRFFYASGVATTGNYVGVSSGSDQGTRNTPAFGYIFVR